MSDVPNMQLVSVRGLEIMVMMPRNLMTKREALVHAAWLVALADDEGNVKRHSLERMDSMIEAVSGKRLTYAGLTA